MSKGDVFVYISEEPFSSLSVPNLSEETVFRKAGRVGCIILF